MNAKELDEYLFILKSEITNLRTINEKISNQLTNFENENNNLKSQISKLAIENSSLEHFIRTKKIISSVIYESYRDILTKFENA
jgi:predicted nuclease with TOPRIM domain